MVRIKPFAALRPPAELAESVASVPYDVVNRDEAALLARDNPNSFLHVIRPDIDLPADTPPGSPVLFETAAGAFKRFRDQGILRKENHAALYIYRLEAELLGEKVSQTGLVCCCHIEDYEKGIIKKHEKTRKDKEDERTRHVVELNANAEPVFFMYPDRREIDVLFKEETRRDPLYDFTTHDGVRHTIWKVAETEDFVEVFERVPALYVADGHHRTASAARAGAEKRAKNPRHTGNEEYNWFMAVLFPAGQLSILPYHRVVKDLNGMSAGEFLDKLKGRVKLEESDDPAPPGPGSACMYLDGKWWRLTFPADTIDLSDPVEMLDYVALSEHVLEPLLGIRDIRTDKRIDFVGGIRGTKELERLVDTGRAAVAFSMYPTTIEQLIAVADAGQIMPPKSTWFEPKLRSGLLVHTFD